MSDTMPEWAANYLPMWRDILLLGEWKIHVRLSANPNPNGDANPIMPAKAATVVYYDILTARIELLDTIPKDPAAARPEEIADWQITIIHELLHIKFGRLMSYVDDVLIPALRTAEGKEMAAAGFIREYEPTIEGMARLLHGLLHIK